MRLYLAYTELIYVFKIDLIALTITSQLINCSAQPLKFIACYSILTIVINLPSMIIQAKSKR